MTTDPLVNLSHRVASRRTVLIGGAVAGLGGALALGGGTAAAAPAAAPTRGARLGEVFTLGVASGDPLPNGVVLWTRLARRPLAADGLGGMPNRPVAVQWEVAEDPRFGRRTRRGTVVAEVQDAHSVHVEVSGLRPGREYFYRFRAEGALSPVGRTRTAPAPGTLTSALTMCFASCAQYEHGYFTAYRRMAEDEPGLVLFLGDYNYEYAANDYVAPGGNLRDHAGPETVTLANYRQRHAQYKSDLDLQAAHAAAPWLVVPDDHEVENNWADEVPEEQQPNFLARRASALQAYYENMPLRRSARPRGTSSQLYRRVEWGALSTFHMLDTRQYRDDQPLDDRFNSDGPTRTDPTRSITGDEQEAWLVDGLRRSRSRWNVLGQQVFFSQVDFTPGAGRGFNPDAWDGYTGSRDRIVQGMIDGRTRNPVVLTGDVHANWAANVKERFDDPSSRTIATELVTTSITSGGDGSEVRADTATTLAENPHVQYYNNRRGYVRTTITAREMRADYRTVPYVSAPGAPVQTAASFVLQDRIPGLNRV